MSGMAGWTNTKWRTYNSRIVTRIQMHQANGWCGRLTDQRKFDFAPKTLAPERNERGPYATTNYTMRSHADGRMQPSHSSTMDQG